MVHLSWYMTVSAILFSMGVFGFLTRRNLIMMLLCIELMLNAINLNLVAISHYMEDMRGQVLVFFIIAVAAAEAAIGLGLIVTLFRNVKSVYTEDLTTLKG